MEGYDYEVFLSFNGSDTHKDFADFLYTALVDTGIRTYRDDGDLRDGEEIGPDLLRVIQQSKISIPILSESYVSDEWCLEELAEMMECRKRKGQVIMPIFYHVESSEVTYPTGGYGKALLEHENKKRADDEAIRKLRAALTEVGALKGWNVDKANRRKGQLVKEVVTTVFNELKKGYLAVTDCLVGIDNSVKEVLQMIGTDTDDVKIVGIHGVGGIGKSTLAKEVYKKLYQDFSSHCFLRDVREISHRKGIMYFQTLLISDLSKQTHPSIINVDEGIRTIENKFSGEKVLILLDDVDEKDQLIALLGRRSCFGPGSRILITTREMNVLSEFGVKLTYSICGMNPDISLQLFSKHAFRRDSPPPEKMEMSREFVKMANGHPLILEVMGSTSQILGQREETWDDCLVKWRKDFGKWIRNKLKISYEVLDSSQQKIFLDIACLFAGYDKSMVIHFWRDHGLCPEVELEVLQSRSLIKIREDNKLWMHDELKGLGKEVISQESQGKLDKQSRLWNHEDSLKILWGMKGTESVEAVVLKFERCRPPSFCSNYFASMSNIRFLQLDQATLEGNFGQRLSSLRWLHWEGCPQFLPAENLGLEKLVILDLSRSKVNESWNGWREIEKAKNLKVLNLTGCVYLIKTPDLSNFTYLERLILKKCSQLVEIDSSVKSLHRLVSLDLRFCCDLQKLPEELGSLKSLKEILADENVVSVSHLPNHVRLTKPANTQHSSSKGVKRKHEGIEGRIDNISSNDDQLTELNSLPDGGTEWIKIGKIHVSSKEIGKGSNGTIVYEGKYEKRPAAVKRLVLAHVDAASKEIDNLIASDRHKNVIRYYGKEKDRSFVYLALELCTCSLDDLIQAYSGSSNNPRFRDDPAALIEMMQDVNLWCADGYPSPSLVELMRDMVSGLSQLHGLGIIHRDLKPSNFLITKNPFGAKVSDMGSSRFIPDGRSSLGSNATNCGTTGWRAPEQLSREHHTQAMDLFSLGCVLFFCVTRGRHPFGENTEREANITLNKMDLSLVEKIPEAHDLFSRLLSHVANERPKASEVLCHPFFWTPKMRLSFLHDVSDEVESKACKGNFKKALKGIAPLVYDGKWDEKIDEVVMDNLRQYRPYDGSCVTDLLRVVRNKFNHRRHALEDVKEILGSDPDGMDAYFAERFPRLLIETYRVVCKCKKKELIAEVLSK